MVINGDSLLMLSPISDMLTEKQREFGVSHGLAEVGYDIRLKQEILFIPGKPVILQRLEHRDTTGLIMADYQLMTTPEIYRFDDEDGHTKITGNMILASAIERFQMPDNLVGIVHDKSTWARQGLSVYNTVIEPRWEGYLTLELAFKGNEPVHIPAGAGIAQVVFHQTAEIAAYSGKYQNQENRPMSSVFA